MRRDAATQRQVDAADPGNSTWLSANAGSGKTRVLTDRVARLLLDGVSPQNILCLTYTKAAAAEMQNRLFKRLGAWAMMEAGALAEELRKLGHDGAVDAERLRAARTLFARAIETPGGLKIQTIHSFCGGLLRRFPLEAGVSPQFREMEDRDAERLREEVLDALLAGPQRGVVERLFQRLGGAEPSGLVREVAGRSEALSSGFDEAAMAAYFEVPPGLTPAALVAEVIDARDRAALREVAAACATGSSTDQKAAAKLAKLSTGPHPVPADQALLETVLLTGGSAKAPFSPKIGSFPTKATQAKVQSLLDDQIHPLMERLAEARQTRLGVAALERTRALYDFAEIFLPAYAARKQAMGALDFDDLIGKARALLTDPAVAQWVLFRLDGGIDHVLVDEAQDTSPAQWAVIERLTQEFAAGEGADPDRTRTIFVVGDLKQSIYSFQGADPAEFARMQRHFAEGLAAAQKRLESLTLDHSFRSAQAILSVVDATFAGQAGLGDAITHIAFHETMPGRVDLWPPIEKVANPEAGEWYLPVDLPRETDEVSLMAERVAGQIGRMIAEETLPKRRDDGTLARRPITAGDFLILVQGRGPLFYGIIRACKTAGLDVAGADRLKVGGELAVRDITAVLNFLALPEDDLSLAAALRSPLFGWSEAELYALAQPRPMRGHLWPALRDGDGCEALTILRDLRAKSDFLRPYDLIERLLTRHDGRRRLLARLGMEAEDGIDAMLAQALAYERTGVPSLTGFLAWMESDAQEIKRQMDSQGDRIRVMSVHGAKGLEAPIVILPDTAQKKNELKDALLPSEVGPIWAPVADARPEALEPARQAALDRQAQERMRLLYVAMTRAESWLIVGAAGETGGPGESWHATVAAGMEARGAAPARAGALEVLRVEGGDWSGGELERPAAPPAPAVVLPDFGPVAEQARTATISPSSLAGEKALFGAAGEADRAEAMARGTQLHRLLEHLPFADPAARADLGARLNEGGDPALVGEAMALLDAPALAPVWDEAALAEVEITGEVAGLGRIHGTIDRLIVTPEKVIAVDFKTNREVPEHPQQTPLGIQRQMAAYVEALQAIYPDREVEAVVLWTRTATLMTLPADILREALRTLPTS